MQHQLTHASTARRNVSKIALSLIAACSGSHPWPRFLLIWTDLRLRSDWVR